jgi:uncharacterized oligopeptide transporter (OPT) family protein
VGEAGHGDHLRRRAGAKGLGRVEECTQFKVATAARNIGLDGLIVVVKHGIGRVDCCCVWCCYCCCWFVVGRSVFVFAVFVVAVGGVLWGMLLSLSLSLLLFLMFLLVLVLPLLPF